VLLIGSAVIATANGAAAATPDWGSDSSEKPDEPPPKERDPSSPSLDLGYLVSDLQVAREPNPLWITIALGGRYPYQAFGFGGSLAVYAGQWLRFEATYAFGLVGVVAPHQSTWGSYGELLAGAAVLHAPSETDIKLPLNDPNSGKRTAVPVTVPTYNALFVEAGVITGYIEPARCQAHCDASWYGDQTLVPMGYQLVMAIGGIRYVYFFAARSERAHAHRSVLFQFYAHLISGPFNPPSEPRLITLNGEVVERASWGGRVGFEAPPFCPDCLARIGMSLGYNPVPAGPLFSLHIGF
jgi:hypothetical protein